MSENIILCSTSAFIGTKNNFNHSLIAKLKPDLAYHGFEIFMFDYYASHEKDVAHAARIGG